jgi:hypothetical protein
MQFANVWNKLYLHRYKVIAPRGIDVVRFTNSSAENTMGGKE